MKAISLLLDQQPLCSGLGGEPSVWSPGTSHEKAALPHGARAVRLDPVPIHLSPGVAPVHPHLRTPGGLLQCAHPCSRRLDQSFVSGLWGGGTDPQGALQPAKVGSRSFLICII